MGAKTTAPYADPNHHSYHGPKTKRCFGCGTRCAQSSWGPWCYRCNVERMQRLDTTFAKLARVLGDEEAARELEGGEGDS